MTAIVDQIIAEHGWWISPTPQNRVTHCACGHGLMSEVDESVRDAHRRHQMEAVERAVREQIAAGLESVARGYMDEAVSLGLERVDWATQRAIATQLAANTARGES